MDKQSYIGDGVYVSYDGYHVKLKCDCMSEHNTIAMEPMVIDNLMRFVEDCFNVKIEIKKHKDAHKDGDEA